MLAEAEEFQAELIGEFDLLDEVAEPFRRPDLVARDRIRADIGECVETEFHRLHPVSLPQS